MANFEKESSGFGHPEKNLSGWSELLKEESSAIFPGEQFDEDYIRSVFKRDFDDLKRRVPNSSMEETKYVTSERISEYSSLVFRCLVDGQVTIEELIRDPFLRQRHFDALSDIRVSGKYSDAIRKLWSSDTSFYTSATYFDRIGHVISENPEIYSNVDKKRLERITDDAVDKFSMYIDLVSDEYRKDTRTGNETLKTYLCKTLLGSFGDYVTLRYNQTSLDGAHGEWKLDEREIVLYEEQIIKTVEERNGHYQTREKELCYVNTIAHEVWHAFQDLSDGGDLIPEDLVAMHRENSAYYVPFEYSYNMYRNQLNEVGAFMFGDKLEKFMRKIASF